MPGETSRRLGGHEASSWQDQSSRSHIRRARVSTVWALIPMCTLGAYVGGRKWWSAPRLARENRISGLWCPRGAVHSSGPAADTIAEHRSAAMFSQRLVIAIAKALVSSDVAAYARRRTRRAPAVLSCPPPPAALLTHASVMLPRTAYGRRGLDPIRHRAYEISPRMRAARWHRLNEHT